MGESKWEELLEACKKRWNWVQKDENLSKRSRESGKKDQQSLKNQERWKDSLKNDEKALLMEFLELGEKSDN